ncbi:uncharacterized protein [Drosophila virilis]|uniref:uncharacterized protein n=1 Tax=Drosophila virilis TaxID=7244 RepID=UPI0038B2593C
MGRRLMCVGGWFFVFLVFCSWSGFGFGYGLSAYFSATHPPVSGAPSNVELRVRQCELCTALASQLSCACVRVYVCACVCVCVHVWSSKMTDFPMNDILRSFRKMRMHKCTGQGTHLIPHHNHSHHHHHHHHHHQQQQQQQQQQQIQNYPHYQQPAVQQSKDLKKIIKIIKKSVIKQKITRKMKIVV